MLTLKPTGNIFCMWIKSYQTFLQSLCSYFSPKEQQGALGWCSTSQEWQGELRTVQPCRKEPCAIKMPDFPESRLTCSAHVPAPWDEGQNTITLRTQPPPSRPADIQTGDWGPSLVLCICRRVTQKVAVWKFGRVFLKGSRWMLNPTASSRASHWGNSSFLLLPGSKASFFKARISHP